MRNLILIALSFAASTTDLLAQIGANDPSFQRPVFAPEPKRDRGIVYGLTTTLGNKLLVGGLFTKVNDVPRHRIARLEADGALDPSFELPPEYSTAGSNFTVMRDGKIWMSGAFRTKEEKPGKKSKFDQANVLFEPDGRPGPHDWVKLSRNKSFLRPPDPEVIGDATLQFRPAAGMPVPAFQSMVGTRYLVTLGPDGKPMRDKPIGQASFIHECNDGSFICLINQDFTRNRDADSSLLLRVKPDGTVDRAFKSPPLGSVNRYIVQEDGKIVCIDNLGPLRPQIGPGRIYRLNRDGTQDETFPIKQTPTVRWNCVTLQADGKVLLCGVGTSGAEKGTCLIARLLNDPAIDELKVLNGTTVVWKRGGSAPSVTEAFFDVSTDGGRTWSHLGKPTRSADGWRLEGAKLPESGMVRAVGRVGSIFHMDGVVDTSVPIPRQEGEGSGTGVTL